MTKSLHTPEYIYFRNILISEREQSGLTQVEVATRLCRPQSFVAKYEGGERRLDLIEFMSVCAALGVDPHSIITRIQEKANQ